MKKIRDSAKKSGMILIFALLLAMTAAGCGTAQNTQHKEHEEVTQESSQGTEVLAEKETENPKGTEETQSVAESSQNVQEDTTKDSETTEAADGIPHGYTEINDTVWVTTNVNFRSVDNETSDILAVIPRNTDVTRIAASDQWAYVEYEGNRGYVSMDFVTGEEPKQEETVQEQPEEETQESGQKQDDGTDSTGSIARVYATGGGNGHGQVVVIDAGHQAHGDSSTEPNGPGSSIMKARVAGGTHGTTTGVYEYELTLSIAEQLQTELSNRGYTVYMTRTSHDVNISNKERAEYATSVGADICIRIHANGADNASINGALALAPSSSNPYISDLSADSIRLSQCVLDGYCGTTGMANRGVQTSDTMTGINWCTMPVTILEMGYMTNPSDDTLMENADYQWNMVQGIANGVDQYFQ